MSIQDFQERFTRLEREAEALQGRLNTLKQNHSYQDRQNVEEGLGKVKQSIQRAKASFAGTTLPLVTATGLKNSMKQQLKPLEEIIVQAEVSSKTIAA